MAPARVASFAEGAPEAVRLWFWAERLGVFAGGLVRRVEEWRDLRVMREHTIIKMAGERFSMLR